MQIHHEIEPLKKAIFQVQSDSEFQSLAIEVFRFQYNHIPVYKAFVDALGRNVDAVKTLEDIPFMPIEFFKSHQVIPEGLDAEIEFTSSGTTGKQTSTHFVHDLSIYKEGYRKCFEHFYGPIEDYVVLALLPAYLERKGSSLVWMVNDMIEQSKYQDSGFFLNEYEALSDLLKYYSVTGKKVILFGVTFALLDLADQFPVYFPKLTLVETGGMKGRRKEMLREELHKTLSTGFGVKHVHSEYGMTELLSQAWSKGDGIFRCPPWMKVMIRESNDPFAYVERGVTGGINVIDLANLYSCSFIATSDLGKSYPDGSFEVLGRFDQSDVRGCNLLVV